VKDDDRVDIRDWFKLPKTDPEALTCC